MIKGIQIGQAQDETNGTGCTVILCKNGATAGVDVRGGGPATRETDLLNPKNMVQQIHAVMLSGGSAFGLDACSGAMRYLEEQGCGFEIADQHVPIVCGASLFDLCVGNGKIRPDAAIVMEGTLLDVVTAHKGTVRWRITSPCSFSSRTPAQILSTPSLQIRASPLVV